jgi:thymidylate synthase
MPKSEETAYLLLLEKLLNHGSPRKTRNSTTYSLFSERLEFSLSNNTLPLLTTKRTFWKGIIEELLWFIRGDTDNTKLKEKGVHIWDGNTTEDFLRKSNLPYKEDICGPIYGYQWRRFGEEYTYTDPETQEEKTTTGVKVGFDQLQEVINLIRNNPTSRRIFMSGWNPAQMSQMCLPPCHVSYQFYVEGDKLSCQMYQRSADVFLGLPFNIASTSALTHLIAHHTGLKASRVIICLGDVHIYKEHLKAVAEQLTRFHLVKPFPTLEISEKYENIEDYTADNFTVQNYQSEKRIAAPMIA